MIIVDVFVPGAAKTKGSMEIRNRATGAMKESVVGSSRWRALMAQAVRDDIERRQAEPHAWIANPIPHPGPVAVTVVAYLASPYDSGAYLAPIWPRAGDLDKIVRNVLDALGSQSKNPKMNGGAIVDDNLVCDLIARKRVAGATVDTMPAGVHIIVETL